MYGRLIFNMFGKIACSLLIFIIVTVAIVVTTVALMIVVPFSMFEGIVKEKKSFMEALHIIKEMLNASTDHLFETARDSLFKVWA